VGGEVAGEQGGGEVGLADAAQVHDEEGEVGDRVGAAELVRELDAVEDDEVARRGALGEEVEVLEAEVAVGVAGDLPAGAGLDEVVVAGEGVLGAALEGGEQALVDRGEAGELGEVLAGVGGDGVEGGEGGDVGAATGGAVKAEDLAADPPQEGRLDGTPRDAAGEGGLVGHAAHVHGDLDDLADRRA
jgi:hypothetical protein